MLERSDEISVSPTSEGMSAQGTHAAGMRRCAGLISSGDEARTDSTNDKLPGQTAGTD